MGRAGSAGASELGRGPAATEIRRRTEPGTRGAPGGCYGPLVKQTNHKRHLVSACFALGSCAGCSNMPVRSLMRTRRRRRATGRGTKRGICQARRWPVAPRARAAGSPTATTQRTEDRAPFASLSDLFEEQHRKARRCSQQATWHRGARRSQAGSCHRARRGIFSGPLAVGRSRELAPRPPTVSCSSNHGELHVAFRSE